VDLDLNLILDHWDQLWVGLKATLIVSILGIVGSVVIALVAAVLLQHGPWVTRVLVRTYIELIRGTPLLVQAFFLYFGLPEVGIRLDAFTVASLSLILWGGAYNAENLRAGMDAVNTGLREAAAAMGFNSLQTLRFVVIPIGLRVSLPSVTNISISVLKQSALLIAVGYRELTYAATSVVYETFRVAEMFLALGIIYLALVWTLSWLAGRLQKHWGVVGVAS
jgi:polar amino acid transport system permease protein